MTSNSKTSSTVIHNNPEVSYSYRRTSKRRLQPVHETCTSKTCAEDLNDGMSSLTASEEQSHQKVVVLECGDVNTFPENFSKRPFDSQKYFTPRNERNPEGNIFISQQEEDMNSRNMQRRNDNVGANEEKAPVSASKAEFAIPVKNFQWRDAPLLSDPTMDEEQTHEGSVPSTAQLPMTSIFTTKAFSQRGQTEETQKTIVKVDNPVDGSHSSPFNAINIIPKIDEFDSIGLNIASKLRRLPREQSILAEKLIHDVMYEAALGMLNRSSKILTPSSFGTNWGNITSLSSSLSTPNNSFNEFSLYPRLLMDSTLNNRSTTFPFLGN